MTIYAAGVASSTQARRRIPLSPDQIRHPNLPRAGVGRRGYAEAHVDALLDRIAADAERAVEVNQGLRAQLQHAKDALRQWHIDYQTKLQPGNVDAVNLMSRAQRQADELVTQAQDYAARLSWEAKHHANTILATAHQRAEIEAEKAVHAYRHESGRRYAAEIEEMERRLAWLQAFTQAIQVQLTTAAQAFVEEVGKLTELIPERGPNSQAP
jgi:DivIVA domain-containing protein